MTIAVNPRDRRCRRAHAGDLAIPIDSSEAIMSRDA